MKGKRAKLCKERKKGLKSIEIEEVFIPTPFVVNFPQIKCTSLQSLKNASRHFIFQEEWDAEQQAALERKGLPETKSLW